jgi:spore germination cell wall hydrolase CwlJ-like protein
LFYHADYVNPHWRKAKKQTVQIGRHIFYVRKDMI